MKLLFAILFFALNSIAFSQNKITTLEYYDKIDSFQIGDKFINPGSYSLDVYKTIYIPAKSEVILKIYDDSSNKIILEYFNDTLDYGKYFIDFEKVFPTMKSGIYRIELSGKALEDYDLFPEEIVIERKFIFIL